MTALDAPDSEEATRLLLNPRRSAHATIRGYLYQTCLGVLRWLDLKPGEILLCEGDEDLDRFLLGGEAVSEQVKAYTGGLSLSDRAVVESLGNFLRSYVALRRRGETRSFVFTTTAHEKKRRIGRLNFDLLEEWKNGSRKPEVLTAVRSLLEPRESDKNHEETTEASAWLNAQPQGWKSFMDSVEWSFDAPDLDAIRAQVKNRLAVCDATSDLPAEIFLERLIAYVLWTSSRSKPEDRMLDSKSLSSLIDTARNDLRNWAKTPAAVRLRTLFDEFQQIRRLLHDNIDNLPEKENLPPGRLLSAAYEVIPFDVAGRREELDFLTRWCNNDKTRSVLLLTGEGGSGKTRLMIEWCRYLRHQGWHAGFLRPDHISSDIYPLVEGVAPRLIVIDYAETQLRAVEPLLQKVALQAEGEGPKTRLVLLARRQGYWWEALSRFGRKVEDLLLNSPEPRTITQLIPKDIAERREAFRIAVDRFSLQLGRKIPMDLHIPDLSRDEFERVLYLHMAALAALQGERIETADDALNQTLRHEQRFWYHTVSYQGLDAALTTIFNDAFELAEAALTLVGGAKDLNEAVALLRRALKDFYLPDKDLRVLAQLLRNLYGGSTEKEDRIIYPLQPDLLGEELVAEVLNKNQELLSWILTDSSPGESYSVLTVLTRIAKRRPGCGDWINFSLRGRLEDLAEAALRVAIDTGDPLRSKLLEELEAGTNISPNALIKLQQLCDSRKYRRSVPLIDVAHLVTERGLSLLRAQQQFNPGEAQQIKYSNLADNLGFRLSALGRREDALTVTKEAVAIKRRLADRNPSFLPNLASGLNNLGIRLSALNQHEEAFIATKEAVLIRKRLAQSDPTFLPDLASSLNNLGNRLAAIGQEEEALSVTREAVHLSQRLAELNPDAFSTILAGNLSSLGNKLSTSDPNEALRVTQQSVEIRRKLVQERPDAFLPDLAKSLNNLGQRLSEIGHHSEALRFTNEAIEIRRQLAQDQPDAFKPDLAKSLNNLGDHLRSRSMNDAALRAYEEAFQTLTPYFLRLPKLFHQQMAKALKNYSALAEATGKTLDEALLNPVKNALNSLSD